LPRRAADVANFLTWMYFEKETLKYAYDFPKLYRPKPRHLFIGKYDDILNTSNFSP